MIYIGNPHGDGSGRRILDQTRRDFFQAIEDARPQRIQDAVDNFSVKELRKKIDRMDRCGCSGQAEEYREALRRKLK